MRPPKQLLPLDLRDVLYELLSQPCFFPISFTHLLRARLTPMSFNRIKVTRPNLAGPVQAVVRLRPETVVPVASPRYWGGHLSRVIPYKPPTHLICSTVLPPPFLFPSLSLDQPRHSSCLLLALLDPSKLPTASSAPTTSSKLYVVQLVFHVRRC